MNITIVAAVCYALGVVTSPIIWLGIIIAHTPDEHPTKKEWKQL